MLFDKWWSILYKNWTSGGIDWAELSKKLKFSKNFLKTSYFFLFLIYSQSAQINF